MTFMVLKFLQSVTSKAFVLSRTICKTLIYNKNFTRRRLLLTLISRRIGCSAPYTMIVSFAKSIIARSSKVIVDDVPYEWTYLQSLESSASHLVLKLTFVALIDNSSVAELSILVFYHLY